MFHVNINLRFNAAFNRSVFRDSRVRRMLRGISSMRSSSRALLSFFRAPLSSLFRARRGVSSSPSAPAEKRALEVVVIVSLRSESRKASLISALAK